MRVLAVAITLAAALRAGGQDAAVTIKFEPHSAVGDRIEFSFEETLVSKTVAHAGRAEVFRNELQFVVSIKGLQTVLRAEGGRPQEVSCYINRATRREKGAEIVLPFQGKTALIRHVDDARRSFQFDDGSEIDAESRDTLNSALPSRIGAVAPGGTWVMLDPRRAVRVGDSWKPEVTAAFLGEDLAPRAATTRATLKSLDKGIATLTATVECGIMKFDGLSLSEPLALTFEERLELDPDGRLGSTAASTSRISGESGFEAKDGTARTLSVDIRRDQTRTRVRVAPAEPDRRYTIHDSEKAPMAAGEIYDILCEQALVMTTVVRDGETVLRRTAEETWSRYRAREEIQEVADGKPTRWRSTFSDAKRLVDGKKAAWPFEGRALLVSVVKSRNVYEREDGVELSGDEREALAGALKLGPSPRKVTIASPKEKPVVEGRDDKLDRAAGIVLEKLLIRGAPVKLGESWTVDGLPLLGDMKELDPDPKSLKVAAGLTAVEKRRGALFGLVCASITFAVRKFAPLELESPASIEFLIDAELPLDENRPEVWGRVRVESKGTATTTPPNAAGPVSVDFTNRGTARYSRWRTK